MFLTFCQTWVGGVVVVTPGPNSHFDFCSGPHRTILGHPKQVSMFVLVPAPLISKFGLGPSVKWVWKNIPSLQMFTLTIFWNLRQSTGWRGRRRGQGWWASSLSRSRSFIARHTVHPHPYFTLAKQTYLQKVNTLAGTAFKQRSKKQVPGHRNKN